MKGVSELAIIIKLRILKNFKSKDYSVSIHHNNIHALAIEMYKVANDMS